MSINKLLGGALVVQLVIVGTLLIAPAQTRTQPASAAQAFDHSNCQYPDRWTNPVDGCDNSDPAVPECIKAFSTKAGEDACIAAFVAANQIGTAEKQQAIAEHDAAFNSAPANVSECGGK